MFICFGILRYVSKYSPILWVLGDVRYVSHLVIANQDLKKKYMNNKFTEWTQ